MDSPLPSTVVVQAVVFSVAAAAAAAAAADDVASALPLTGKVESMYYVLSAIVGTILSAHACGTGGQTDSGPVIVTTW